MPLRDTPYVFHINKGSLTNEWSCKKFAMKPDYLVHKMPFNSKREQPGTAEWSAQCWEIAHQCLSSNVNEQAK